MSRRQVITNRTTARPVNSVMTSSGNPPFQDNAFLSMQKGMEAELEKRRVDWEKDVERMSENFFSLPTGSVQLHKQGADKTRNVTISQTRTPRIKCTDNIIDIGNSGNNLFSEMPDGSQLFQMRFDLNGCSPNEISVRAVGRKLHVQAKHEEQGSSGQRYMKNFNRAVDIPSNVDPDKIECFFSSEGILCVEAPAEKVSLPGETNLFQMKSLTDQQTPVEFTATPPSGFTNEPMGNFNVSVNNFGLSPTKAAESEVVRPIPQLKEKAGMDLQCYSSPVMQESSHGNRLKMVVDIGTHYDSSEILVKLDDGKIYVKAKKEINKDGRSSKREFSREFDVPQPVEPGTLQARLSKEGKLFIGASSSDNLYHEEIKDLILSEMPAGSETCYIES